jgi:hypothetical protein
MSDEQIKKARRCSHWPVASGATGFSKVILALVASSRGSR